MAYKYKKKGHHYVIIHDLDEYSENVSWHSYKEKEQAEADFEGLEKRWPKSTFILARVMKVIAPDEKE